MGSGDRDGDRGSSAEAGDRKLLFGLPAEGEARAGGDRAAGPAADAAPGPPTADVAAALAGLVAGQRRLESKLDDLAGRLAAPAGEDADLAGLSRTISAATEWANDIRAATERLVAENGKLIAGLETGHGELGTVSAALKGGAESLEGHLTAFEGSVEDLDERLDQLEEVRKHLDRRLSQLLESKREFAVSYANWTADGTAFRREVSGLSERIDEGDRIVVRLRGELASWTDSASQAMAKQAAVQREAAAEATAKARELTEAGDALVRRFQVAASDATKGLRREGRRARSFAVPLLAVALLFCIPFYTLLGALGQSHFGPLEPYDGTGGWKQEVWTLHGKQIKECMAESGRRGQAIDCRVRVRYP